MFPNQVKLAHAGIVVTRPPDTKKLVVRNVTARF